MKAPAGSAIRRMRVSVTQSLEDGSTVKMTVTAFGFIARLGHVQGQKPSDTRREFLRMCRAKGLIATACEWSGGVYSRRTGERIPGTEAAPTAFQVLVPDDIDSADAVDAVCSHRTVAEVHAALAVRVPVIASGSGEERPRPSSGSMFGKPNTVSATAAAIARQNDNAHTAARKAWGEMD